jgi:hypothetical protein
MPWITAIAEDRMPKPELSGFCNSEICGMVVSLTSYFPKFVDQLRRDAKPKLVCRLRRMSAVAKLISIGLAESW